MCCEAFVRKDGISKDLKDNCEIKKIFGKTKQEIQEIIENRGCEELEQLKKENASVKEELDRVLKENYELKTLNVELEGIINMFYSETEPLPPRDKNTNIPMLTTSQILEKINESDVAKSTK